jgi:2-dehydro-3-deoxyphosphogluconate aldolase/(4S)-4-hydroxy-2-oxoglutarate aldolase
MGHIGIETACIARAVAYFKRRGFDFIDESAGYDEKGNLSVIYFRDEIMGYALHLSARK